MELELGWGLVHYGKLDALSSDRKKETQALERLLDLCDELEIPITFNVVGHLLRDEPLANYDGGHEPGWFDPIPKTGPEEDPEFYAPDLIDRIESADIDHEICTHTFSHVECADVSHETLRWEFDTVFDTHETYGLERPVSIVPPRHSPPPRDILQEYGIEIVRSPRSRGPNTSEASNRFQLAIDILTGSQPITPPRLVEETVETYGTRYPSLTAPFLRAGQQEPHTVFKSIPVAVRQWLHRRNLNETLSTAIERDSYAHFWSHLWETANGDQWPQIEGFLDNVARVRDESGVTIRTMSELNRTVRSTAD
ncbi:hypothetical protein EL22_11450 [Halostagnicola sp. A56]|uniref:polysaccharide deacetylase family protein n=1 Tax=Halostagnicola sp. A56 TaxID=1495067 RepID=UPI00065F6A6A|nr:polysaccharide deacetylase family protein [Halostagnicola sp. A56]KDE60081.2 hypothetical protein EL22_11450 [Halostagnicola sp. A56]